MIRINCTNCKAQLSIDEAFAGGVCRCQYCGTIQTVPKHLKADAAAPVPSGKPAGNGDPSKVQHKKKSRTVGADLGLSSGLDAIADAVASSGLSGSGLTSNYGLGQREPLVEPAPRPTNNKLLPLLVISGILIVLLVGVVIGLLMKGSSGGAGNNGAPDNGSGNESSNSSPVVAPADTRVTGPAMLGLPLNESSIIFLLDHGSAMRGSMFDYEKLATLNAIESLRPEQKFQVIFWKADERDPVMVPRTLVSASNREEVKKCAAAMDQVVATGASVVGPAIEKAIAAKPTAIVLVTGKQMDDTLLKSVMDARKSNTTRVHCLSLGEKGNTRVMQEIAHQTGGIFKFVTPEQLQAVSR
jgi:hypothetical protein